MRNQVKVLALFTLLTVILAAPPAAFGQDQPPTEYRVIELGVRQFWGDVYGRPDLPFQPSLRTSKFNEYRNITNGFFVRRADVLLENTLSTGNYLRVQTQSTLLKDEAYLVTFGRLGKYKFQFRWDQTPHIFSNTGQSLFTQSKPGVFTLPAAMRNSLAADPEHVPALLAGTPTIDLSLRRKTATASATASPSRDWTVGFLFSREKQAGARPIGTYSSGYELPEPIDYRTTRIQAQAEYGKQKGAIQFGYLGSIFENKVDTLVWDTGFTATGQGRIDLYPNNAAHGLNVAGALDLSKSTRVLASITPGWMRQNDAFVPFSINPVAGGAPELPARSLNGSKQTLAMNYSLVNHAVKHVELAARFRAYDYNNNTPSLFFPAYVLLDGGRSDLLPGTSRRMPRQSLPYEFARKNVELSASWEFLPKNSLKAGYEFERYDRQHRDVGRSDENAFVTSLDLNPSQLTLFRLSYRHANRSPGLYLENTDGYPLGVEPARQQLADMRRFDEASRARDRVEALFQFNPLPSVTFDASYGTTQDRFNRSLYGLLKDIGHYYTFDISYSPRAEFSLFGEYARENYRTRQRSRLFCTLGDLLCQGVNNSPNNDWESANRNLVDTWTGGIDIFLARRHVTLTTFYSLSAAKDSNITRALGNSRLPGYLLDTALADCRFGGCTPMDFPNVNNRLHNAVASIKFALSKTVSPRLEYRFEQYDRVDWQTQIMRPYMAGVDRDSDKQMFLGADMPSYRVHVLAFTFEFRF